MRRALGLLAVALTAGLTPGVAVALFPLAFGANLASGASFQVHLPIMMDGKPEPEEAMQALGRANLYRELAGARPLQEYRALREAA